MQVWTSEQFQLQVHVLFNLLSAIIKGRGDSSAGGAITRKPDHLSSLSVTHLTGIYGKMGGGHGIAWKLASQLPPLCSTAAETRDALVPKLEGELTPQS